MPDYKHGVLISLRRNLGYLSNKKLDGGICAGFSMMGLQAFVLQKALEKAAEEKKIKLPKENQFLKFLKRLDFIAINHEIIPNLIKKSKDKLKKKTYFWDSKKFEHRMLEVASFMDEMDGYQNPDLHKPIFEKWFNQSKKIELSYYFQSKLLEERGGLCELANFTGSYSQDELELYAWRLHRLGVSSKTDLAFSLSGSKHAISICYDNKENVWFILDANKMPIRKVATSNKLAEEIFSSFFGRTGDAVILHTQMITSKDREKEMQVLADTLLKDPDFNSLHTVTLEKAKRTNARKENLLDVAAESGDLNVFKSFVKLKNPQEDFAKALNHQTDKGSTLAYGAAERGNVAILKLLARFKNPDGSYVVDFNKATERGVNPAFIATQAGQVEVLKFLATLQNPDGSLVIDFNKAKKDGATLAFFAIQKKYIEILRLLTTLKNPNGSLVIDFNQTIQEEGPPLILIAAEEGNIEAFELLATLKNPDGSYVVDFNKALSTNEAMTSAFVAARDGQLEVFRFLTRLKNPDGSLVVFGSDVVTNAGVAPLFGAVMTGQVGILKLLAELKNPDGSYMIDFNVLLDDETPAFIAAQEGRLEVLKFFATLKNLDGSLVIDFAKPLKDGRTLEAVATQNGHIEVVKFLNELKKPVESIESSVEKKPETGSFVQRHWKAMLVGGLIVGGVALALTLGLAAPLIVTLVGIGAGVLVGVGASAAIGKLQDQQQAAAEKIQQDYKKKTSMSWHMLKKKLPQRQGQPTSNDFDFNVPPPPLVVVNDGAKSAPNPPLRKKGR